MNKFRILFPLFIAFIFLTSCSTTEFGAWHLNEMNANRLWEHSTGESQTIAFIDTGISRELAEHLGNRLILRENVLDGSNNVNDVHGHGTEMVSLAASNGFMGVYGVAPNANVIVIKAVSNEGVTNNQFLLESLRFARENGATIISVSLGGHRRDEDVINEIQAIIAQGITVVAAAGDYRQRDLLFPANQEGVISVEGRAKNNTLLRESNRNEQSVLRIPAEELSVLSFRDNETITDIATGTSQATAVASGYIALIRDFYEQQSAELLNEDLIEILQGLNSKFDEPINFLQPFVDF